MQSAIVPYLFKPLSVRTAFDLLDVSLRTIGNTTRTITGLASSPKHKTAKDLEDYLNIMDLVYKLDIIRAFVSEIVSIESPALRAAIDGVTNTMAEITRVTSKLQSNVEYNRSLYIKYLFKIDMTDNINQLEQLVNTLFGRFNLLCTIQLSLKSGTNPV
jgi:hypothetical protein